MIEMIGIGNLITIVVYVITMIVGYVRITEKVKVNEKRIDKNCKHIERMENKIKLQYQNKFNQITKQISAIKKDVQQISTQLGKMNGMLQIFLKTFDKK